MFKVDTIFNKVRLSLTTSLNCPILWFEGAGKENFGVERADFVGMKGNSRVKDFEKIFKKIGGKCARTQKISLNFSYKCARL
jgi:hypothetical protein